MGAVVREAARAVPAVEEPVGAAAPTAAEASGKRVKHRGEAGVEVSAEEAAPVAEELARVEEERVPEVAGPVLAEEVGPVLAEEVGPVLAEEVGPAVEVVGSAPA